MLAASSITTTTVFFLSSPPTPSSLGLLPDALDTWKKVSWLTNNENAQTDYDYSISAGKINRTNMWLTYSYLTQQFYNNKGVYDVYVR